MTTVLITGASSGIGLALARAYARDGVNLVLNARDETKLAAAAESLGDPARRVLVAGDIAAPATIERVLRAAVQHFERLDVLINNAGVFRVKPIAEYGTAEIDEYLSINLRGTILLTQAAVAQLRAQRRGGAIVNITSAISLAPIAQLPAAVPNATKGALNTFTRSLAIELAAEDIRVNAVAPGLIETPLLGENPGRLDPMQPMGHIGAPDDVVAAVKYLAAAPFVTGVILPIDGGSSLGHW
ncbi:MAG TPA: SDR family oxidoreductase [Polyangiales bacterium]|nr:SDR family oxidoreductase [Polyangiales bacterium]